MVQSKMDTNLFQCMPRSLPEASISRDACVRNILQLKSELKRIESLMETKFRESVHSLDRTADDRRCHSDLATSARLRKEGVDQESNHEKSIVVRGAAGGREEGGDGGGERGEEDDFFGQEACAQLKFHLPKSSFSMQAPFIGRSTVDFSCANKRMADDCLTDSIAITSRLLSSASPPKQTCLQIVPHNYWQSKRQRLNFVSQHEFVPKRISAERFKSDYFVAIKPPDTDGVLLFRSKAHLNWFVTEKMIKKTVDCVSFSFIEMKVSFFTVFLSHQKRTRFCARAVKTVVCKCREMMNLPIQGIHTMTRKCLSTTT